MDSPNTLKKEMAVIAITKNGISIAHTVKNFFPYADIYVPEKFYFQNSNINFFDVSINDLLGSLFNSYNSLICIFSLGAVIRLLSPFLKNKKTDPAVIVIDDASKFVISALSGHLGGANDLTLRISQFLKSIPVVTTAADVNNTISVDLIGKKFGWIIEDFKNVTTVSALMVNEEKIGIFQDAGEKNWWNGKAYPNNVEIVSNFDDLKSKTFKGCIIITDRIIFDNDLLLKSVIYRPKSLVVGIGLHWNTSKDTIKNSLNKILNEYGLSYHSIRSIASLNRGKPVDSLSQFCNENNFELLLYSKDELNKISVPNPSKIVGKYEGTQSVSEASALIASNGVLIVPKRKFPPDLTIAICRVNQS